VSEAPLVSIVVACYNHGDFIEESLRSVFAQDYPNIELIVVNDGSTDRSLEVIERLRSEHHFTLINQSNQGVTRAVSAGLEVARGEFFLTFDSDDIMLPSRISIQVGHLLKHPELGGCGANFQFIDAQGAPMKGAPNKPAARYRFKDFFENDDIWLGGPTAVFRREAVLKAGGYDINNRIQDHHLELRITHAGYPLDIIEDMVTLYRQHGRNQSHNYKGNYPWLLMGLDCYRDHPGYMRGKRSLINNTLRSAVKYDREFARQLFSELPWYRWNGKTIKRYRHFLFKYRPGKELVKA